MTRYPPLPFLPSAPPVPSSFPVLLYLPSPSLLFQLPLQSSLSPFPSFSLLPSPLPSPQSLLSASSPVLLPLPSSLFKPPQSSSPLPSPSPPLSPQFPIPASSPVILPLPSPSPLFHPSPQSSLSPTRLLFQPPPQSSSLSPDLVP